MPIMLAGGRAVPKERTVNYRRALIAAVIAAAALSAVPPAPAADLSVAPLSITSCQVMSGSIVPQRNEVGLAIRFTNTSADPLTSIVVRAKYGAGWIDFEDDGSFAPHVRIDNFLAYEAGTSKINWVAAAAAVLARAPLIPGRITSLHFDDYIGLADPQNCTVMRTVSERGGVYTNSHWPKPHALLPTPGPDPRSTEFPAVPRPVRLPVDFAHCRLILQGVMLTNPSLTVAFRNNERREAKRIVFRASYGTGAIDFTDAGAFAPGIIVRHQLKTRGDASTETRTFTSFDDPAVCDVVRVEYADGAVWTNAQLPAAAPSSTPVPDAIRIAHQKLMWSLTPGDPKP